MSRAKRALPFFIFIFFIFFILPDAAFSGQVSGKITASRGRDIQILLDITAPAPNTIILTLHLPVGTTVISAKPAFAKALPEKGEVNWLLSDVKPGKVQITCTLDKKAGKGEIVASARYKSPLTGKMEEATLAY